MIQLNKKKSLPLDIHQNYLKCFENSEKKIINKDNQKYIKKNQGGDKISEDSISIKAKLTYASQFEKKPDQNINI